MQFSNETLKSGMKIDRQNDFVLGFSISLNRKYVVLVVENKSFLSRLQRILI